MDGWAGFWIAIGLVFSAIVIGETIVQIARIKADLDADDK